MYKYEHMFVLLYYKLETLSSGIGKNIYVIGHSLSNVDIPYFKWLYQTTRANWVIGYHNDEDYVKIKEQITKNN